MALLFGSDRSLPISFLKLHRESDELDVSLAHETGFAREFQITFAVPGSRYNVLSLPAKSTVEEAILPSDL